MAYVKLADISMDDGGQTTAFELYQESATALGTTLKFLKDSDPTLFEGQDGEDLLLWHLPTRFTARVKDDSKYLAGLFATADEKDFRLDIVKGGSLYARLSVQLGSERIPKGRANPVFELRANDGITRLKSIDWDVEALEATFPDGITVAEAFQLLLDAVGHELDVHVYFEWAHANQDTTRPNAHGIRWPVKDFLEGEESRTYYDVLQRLCEYYQAQVFQQGGVWKVMERAYRGGPMDYAKCVHGGSITKVTADDRQVALAESAFIEKGAGKEPEDISLAPIGKAVSRNVFHQRPLLNARFEDWDAGPTVPLGWIKQPAGTPTQVSIDGKRGVQLNASVDALHQFPTETVHQGEHVRVTIDLIDIAYDAVFDSGSVEAELGQVILTNTLDGVDRYLLADGTWSTVATAIKHTIEAHEKLQPVVIDTTIPVAGTLELHQRFSPNPDQSGSDEFDSWTYGEFSYERLRETEPPGKVEFSASSGKETFGGIIEEEFGLGDFSIYNAGAGVSSYLDATSETWKKTIDWGSGKVFHQRRVERRIEQQSQKLLGLDLVLATDTAFSIADTIVVDSVDYVPVYVEESFRRRTRRIIVYELRSDSKNADEVYNPAPAPAARPNPAYTFEFEVLEQSELALYLVVRRDEFTACIQWQYWVADALVDSGVEPFGTSQQLRIRVNPSNSLSIDDESPVIRAWGWSAYNEGEDAGRGIRQARIYENDLFHRSRPDATYWIEFKPAWIPEFGSHVITQDPLPAENAVDLWLFMVPSSHARAIRFSMHREDRAHDYTLGVMDLDDSLEELKGVFRTAEGKVVGINVSYHLVNVFGSTNGTFVPGQKADIWAEVYRSVEAAGAVKLAMDGQTPPLDPDQAITDAMAAEAIETRDVQELARRFRSAAVAPSLGEPTTFVNTIAELKSLRPPARRTMNGIRRISGLLPLVGATYMWDPDSTEDPVDFVIIRPDSITAGQPGRYIRMGPWDAYAFGAAGDGVTDDTAALMRMDGQGE